jgi:hypothetical protein
MQLHRQVRVPTRLLATGLAVFVLASCGGDAGDVEADDVAAEPTTQAAPTTNGETDEGSSESTTGGTSASIDPSTMPPPAQAVVTVDGMTLMYEPQDPEDSRLFVCDLGDDQITVNMQTPEGQDLLVQVVQQDGGEWIGSIVAADPDSDRRYQGTRTYASDAFAVDGQYMVFVGDFDANVISDPGNFDNVGEGQISLTCP